MAAVTWLNALLVACAVGNVGLTVWHGVILRRARRYQADARRANDDAGRLLAQAKALLTGGPALTSNGHRPHEEGAEP